MVTAKMRVGTIEGEDTTNYRKIRLFAVYDPDPASPNFAWSQATPSGHVELVITNPAAFAQFKVADTFMVTFSPE